MPISAKSGIFAPGCNAVTKPMKNADNRHKMLTAVVCLLLLPAITATAETYGLAEKSLQSQRISHSCIGPATATHSNIYLFSTTQTPAVSDVSSYTIPSVNYGTHTYSGRLAPEIYEPFSADMPEMESTGTTRRRAWGDNIGDPGNKDNVSPVGSETILLLLASVWLIIKMRKKPD